MPEITVSMAAGRTDEQKAGMMRDITQALVKNLGVDADAVVIQIKDLILGAGLTEIKDREEYLKKQTEAQYVVDEANLVDEVKKVLTRHDVKWG